MLGENLDVFYNTRHFAVCADYTPAGSPHPSSETRRIKGIPDRAFESIFDTEGNTPVLQLDEKCVPDVTHGAMISLIWPHRTELETFKVVGVHPNGVGDVVLRLAKQ